MIGLRVDICTPRSARCMSVYASESYKGSFLDFFSSLIPVAFTPPYPTSTQVLTLDLPHLRIPQCFPPPPPRSLFSLFYSSLVQVCYPCPPHRMQRSLSGTIATQFIVVPLPMLHCLTVKHLSISIRGMLLTRERQILASEYRMIFFESIRYSR